MNYIKAHNLEWTVESYLPQPDKESFCEKLQELISLWNTQEAKTIHDLLEKDDECNFRNGFNNKEKFILLQKTENEAFEFATKDYVMDANQDYSSCCLGVEALGEK